MAPTSNSGSVNFVAFATPPATPPKTIRCKFRCMSVEKTFSSYKEGSPYLYNAKFSCVTDGSPENKEFFQYTPSGSLNVGTYKEDHFEVGKFYYLDITPAE